MPTYAGNSITPRTSAQPSLEGVSCCVKNIINLIDYDVGRPVRHIVHNLRYDRLVEDVEEVLSSLHSKEREVQTKTGNWYSMRILPCRTTQNVIEGIVVTFVDIADRKRAERELGESEQRYRKIGELVSSVWICTPDGELTYLSKSFMDLMGLTWKDYEGYRWIEKMQLKGPQELLDQWRRCADTGGTWSHRFTITDKDGTPRTIVSRGAAVRNEKDEVTSWVGINLDISDVSAETDRCRPLSD